MSRHMTTRRTALALLLVTACLSLPPVPAQDRKDAPRRADPEVKVPDVREVPVVVKGDCPSPVALTLNAATPNVFNADFTAVQLGVPRAWLNDPAINKAFLYTFQYKPASRCCEISKAILTVKMKANESGASLTSADSGNDGIAIMHLGSTVPPFAAAVYTPPVPAGQPSVKQWTLTGAALNNLKANYRLSVYVQDDTKVESATLQIWGCCLSSTPPKDAAAEASTERQN